MGNGGLRKMKRYVKKQWDDRISAVELTVYRVEERTNDAFEAFNRQNKYYAKQKMIFFDFLRRVIDCFQKSEVEFARLRNGLRITRPKTLAETRYEERLQEEWTKFDEMVAKIEARNPDSVGLLFLRGVEARDRRGDDNEAKSYLEQALWRDQLFVRARVHLLLTQSTDAGVDRQYELLRRASPYHQIVIWGPSLMAKAYVAKRAQDAAR